MWMVGSADVRISNVDDSRVRTRRKRQKVFQLSSVLFHTRGKVYILEDFVNVLSPAEGLLCTIFHDKGPFDQMLVFPDEFNSRKSKLAFNKKEAGAVVNKNVSTFERWRIRLVKGWKHPGGQ
jgi:hypothetical protein